MAAPAPTPQPVDIRLMNGIANVLFAAAGVALAVAALVWLARLPAFGFRTIQVEGELTRNSVGTIRANATPRLAGNFFTLDLAAAKAAFESVPWVRIAVVQRVWPHTLRVRLVEHRPAALWSGDDGNDKLVNAEGEVFEANVGDVEDDGLPRFTGPADTSARMLAMHRRLRPLFEQKLDAHIDAMTLSERGSWRLELDTGAVVELGRGEEHEVVARAERFVRTLTQVTGHYQRPLAYADLRHADGYAVRLRGITTTLTPAQAAAAAKAHAARQQR